MTGTCHRGIQCDPEKIAGVSLSDTHLHYGAPEPGLPLLIVRSDLCEAVISLQGAQLLEFTPRGEKPLLWLSPLAEYTAGRAIRGGVPICLPWFGVHPEDPARPKHGFVRVSQWSLAKLRQSKSGGHVVTLCYRSERDALELFPFRFSAELEISLSSKLVLDLSVKNEDIRPMPVSWAFHSYFSVSALESVSVSGLENCIYLDNTAGLKSQLQQGRVKFAGELDRVYENAGARQCIEGDSPVCVQGENCNTVIVWNPGEDLASRMVDIGADNYRSFICVERGAAFSDSWMLAAGEKKSARLTIQKP
jgi:glucose-6-phosphate 1-epimerase